MMIKGIFLIINLCILGLQITYAQFSTIKEGERVRVWDSTLSSNIITGYVAHLSSDTLKLTSGDSTLKMPVSVIKRIDRSIGKKRLTGRGILIGAVGGSLVGVALVAASSGNGDGNSDSGEWNIHPVTPAAGAGISALLLGIVGGLVGGIVGHATIVDKWSKIPLNNSTKVFINIENKRYFTELKLNVTF